MLDKAKTALIILYIFLVAFLSPMPQAVAMKRESRPLVETRTVIINHPKGYIIPLEMI